MIAGLLSARNNIALPTFLQLFEVEIHIPQLAGSVGLLFHIETYAASVLPLLSFCFSG